MASSTTKPAVEQIWPRSSSARWCGHRGRPLRRLKELASLKDQGVLTDAEFEAQKAKLLSS